MITIAVYDPTNGKIIYTKNVASEEEAQAGLLTGEAYIVSELVISTVCHVNLNTLTIEAGDIDLRTVEQAKLQRISIMKNKRNDMIYGGFSWDGSYFDSDESSQSRILGVFVASQQPGFQPVSWRLADNSWRTLSTEDISNVWLALQELIRNAFSIFAEKEQLINEATSISVVDSITWPT